MVHIQNLSLAFGEQVLFEHLDLTLLPNEWVSLLGCSGVGKSTLLRLIAGLDIQGKIQGNIISHPNIRKWHGYHKKIPFILGFQLLITSN